PGATLPLHGGHDGRPRQRGRTSRLRATTRPRETRRRGLGALYAKASSAGLCRMGQQSSLRSGSLSASQGTGASRRQRQGQGGKQGRGPQQGPRPEAESGHRGHSQCRAQPSPGQGNGGERCQPGKPRTPLSAGASPDGFRRNPSPSHHGAGSQPSGTPWPSRRFGRPKARSLPVARGGKPPQPIVFGQLGQKRVSMLSSALRTQRQCSRSLGAIPPITPPGSGPEPSANLLIEYPLNREEEPVIGTRRTSQQFGVITPDALDFQRYISSRPAPCYRLIAFLPWLGIDRLLAVDYRHVQESQFPRELGPFVAFPPNQQG